MLRSISSQIAASPTSLSTSILTSTLQTLRLIRRIQIMVNHQITISHLDQWTAHHNHYCPQVVLQAATLDCTMSSTKFLPLSQTQAVSVVTRLHSCMSPSEEMSQPLCFVDLIVSRLLLAHQPPSPPILLGETFQP